jgi:hypothetical protein
LIETCKIVDPKDLLDLRSKNGPQNIGSKRLIRTIFRLKDLAAADSRPDLGCKPRVWRCARDFSHRPSQNLDFKELIWWRSPFILAKS